ncbi:hypothetical protein B0H16DRAFT_1506371 [Mycena metata]|uniref:DUF6535 domain-containing protein n=1 Tax=Mycena metata TaxID=1033252 RepID=A0AAD7K1E7_9AGAR|nr:hypothetical protein B0H16DRAFT_1506371 [Mycena metata]
MEQGDEQGSSGKSLSLRRILRIFGLDAQFTQRRTANEDVSHTLPLDPQSDDSSAKFWSVYNSEAERYDSALVESWKADMEGMLIFSGLFSASLTAFIIESYRKLVPDTGDMTVALLLQISQQLSAQSNGSQFSQPAPTPFKAPALSLVCNGLWFVSLSLTLTCALLATLVEQWAREFIHKTEIRPSPVHRARVFSFLYYGVSRFGIHAIVDIIPLLLHIGLVLFFAGLAVFLLPINTLMAEIVSGVLVAFVAFYAVITILPAVSLDCPYRTPLSGIFWRFVQYSAFILHLPSTKRSLTDAVLSAAMQKREIRDERAVLWTLEALTDNTELLPFVEATHDIIHGPTGFRRVDDHLFRLVLQTSDGHTSLPQRMVSLLWSADTLPVNDPLRERRTLAALRGLWALGIVAARTARTPANAVYGVDLGIDSFDIPIQYRLSLRAVIDYAQLKSVQARFEDIAAMLSLRDLSVLRERKRLIRFLRTLLPKLVADCEHRMNGPQIEAILAALRQLAESDPGERAAVALARSITDELHMGETFNWASRYAGVALRLLRASFEEGVAPYKLLPTCAEIVPNILKFSADSQSTVLFPVNPASYPTALHSLLVQGSQNDLDTMMRCGLRLLPLLASVNFIQTVHWYFASRAGDSNTLQYAFEDCNLQVLANKILADLDRGRLISEPTLSGLATLCLLRRDFVRVLDCQRVLAIVRNLALRSDPAYHTVVAILSASSLSDLGYKLAPGRITSDDELHMVEYQLLLHEADNEAADRDIPPSGLTLTTPHQHLLSRVSDRYAATFTQFLAACCNPPEPLPYKPAATVDYLVRNWPFFIIPNMSPIAQTEIAQAIERLVDCACSQDNRGRGNIRAIAEPVWEHLYRGFCHDFSPPTVVKLRHAFSRYQGRPDSDQSEMEEGGFATRS